MSAAMTTVEVPDIGDFDDVPVIEIHVAPGDQIALEDPLVTLESDKATMDVPAPAAGIVKEVVVKVGDKVSQGTALVTLEGDGDGGSDGGGSQPAPPKGAAETEVPKAAAGAGAAAEPESAAPETQAPAAQAAAPRPRPGDAGGGPRRARARDARCQRRSSGHSSLGIQPRHDRAGPESSGYLREPLGPPPRPRARR